MRLLLVAICSIIAGSLSFSAYAEDNTDKLKKLMKDEKYRMYIPFTADGAPGIVLRKRRNGTWRPVCRDLVPNVKAGPVPAALADVSVLKSLDLDVGLDLLKGLLKKGEVKAKLIDKHKVQSIAVDWGKLEEEKLYESDIISVGIGKDCRNTLSRYQNRKSELKKFRVVTEALATTGFSYTFVQVGDTATSLTADLPNIIKFTPSAKKWKILGATLSPPSNQRLYFAYRIDRLTDMVFPEEIGDKIELKTESLNEKELNEPVEFDETF